MAKKKPVSRISKPRFMRQETGYCVSFNDPRYCNRLETGMEDTKEDAMLRLRELVEEGCTKIVLYKREFGYFQTKLDVADTDAKR